MVSFKTLNFVLLFLVSIQKNMNNVDYDPN